MKPYELTLSAAAEEIEARRLSPVELTDSVLSRIDAVDGALHAFACVTADLAQTAAKAAEQYIAAGHYLGACTAFRSASKTCTTLPEYPRPPVRKSARTTCLTPTRWLWSGSWRQEW